MAETAATTTTERKNTTLKQIPTEINEKEVGDGRFVKDNSMIYSHGACYNPTFSHYLLFENATNESKKRPSSGHVYKKQ